MKIKAETRIEINVRDREMYVNYGTYETESEYHGSTHQFEPEIKYLCNAYNETESYKLCNLPIPLVLLDYTL